VLFRPTSYPPRVVFKSVLCGLSPYLAVEISARISAPIGSVHLYMYIDLGEAVLLE
jgi:hypothetical protein